MARLDRSYAFNLNGAITTGTNYRIIGDCIHSDHLPVWRRLWLEPETKRRSTFIMNASILTEAKVQENIKWIWEANNNLTFFGKIRRCVKFYKSFYVKRAQDRKREEDELRRKVESIAAALQLDPSRHSWQHELALASEHLQKFGKWKVEGQRLRSRLKWKEVGDQCSREFFQAHRVRSNASHITELKDVHGQLHTSQVAMAQICSDYYQRLYTTRDSPEAAVGAQEAALSYLTDKIPVKTKQALHAPIS